MYLIKVETALISALLILIDAEKLPQTCPGPKKMVPCNCYYEEAKIKIRCEKIDQKDFEGVINNLRGYEIERITILRAHLRVIPPGTFNRMNVKRLEIINESEVEHFFLFQGLQGLEFSLHSLKFVALNVKYWRLLPDLKFVYLEKFRMRDCPENWKNESNIINYLPEQLTEISFKNCSVSSQEEFSFKRFFYLESLSLSGNRLTYVKRSLVSQPAQFLKLYDLSDNPITTLPDNMFEDMPVLRTIILKNTLLTSIDHYIFNPVLHPQTKLRITNIPLNCNCNAVWLYPIKKYLLDGKVYCQEPSALKYRDFDNLNPADMCPV